MDLNEPRTSSQGSRAGGFAHKRTPSLDRKLDFNVQIKYKNAENQINIKSPQSSEVVGRNSQKAEVTQPISPANRDMHLVEQQFPKKLRTPVYPESNRAGQRRQILGGKDPARAMPKSNPRGFAADRVLGHQPRGQMAASASTGFRMGQASVSQQRGLPQAPGGAFLGHRQAGALALSA